MLPFKSYRFASMSHRFGAHGPVPSASICPSRTLSKCAPDSHAVLHLSAYMER